MGSGPFDKNGAQAKIRQKGEVFFRWYMWYCSEFDVNVLFIYLRTRKMRFNALVFNLRSKVEFYWIRAIRPVIAQSVQFSKIAKKLNIDMCHFFSHQREVAGFFFSFLFFSKLGSPYSFLQ